VYINIFIPETKPANITRGE